MLAGILSAGPPKKKSSKYSRALTQPIQPADRSELASVSFPDFGGILLSL